MAGAAVGVAFAFSFLRWKPFKVEVRGPSMAPTLVPGDWALAVAPGKLRRRDVVVVEHPSRPGFELVKRITGIADELAPDGRILETGEWWVEGDNPDLSTDSRPGHLRPDQGQGPTDLLAAIPATLPLGRLAAIPSRRVGFALAMIRTRCCGLVGAMIPCRCCCPKVLGACL